MKYRFEDLKQLSKHVMIDTTTVEKGLFITRVEEVNKGGLSVILESDP